MTAPAQRVTDLRLLTTQCSLGVLCYMERTCQYSPPQIGSYEVVDRAKPEYVIRAIPIPAIDAPVKMTVITMEAIG